ncbi:somatomedin-B and thrombospondin type-1 domain-containing protein-like isoform X1 [Pteropus medius]|uniref:Somatomedin-B and thrombospondin type-1 domain-containing protein-like n=2 Tax=Pteropus vampyrus TaxID=132908 RepID=A0A6P3QJP8_PTEVA|nr:somatomedin-B and thrombospondin type-1 domain-containing protein-like [Pteropus vampyrus]XP_039720496.1 somatomedin-B and thrombospondin type-1 domain-containing protein-like isoform X1 [Pteropus giganteus]
MARSGAAGILPLALALAAVATMSPAGGPPGTLWPGQGCAALGRCCPGRDLTCAARGPPRCFCDQACGAVRDCCADYARACPAVSCVVAEWSGWSRCVKPCQVSYRVRQRQVLQEPRNGGALCPPLEEQAGCVEYRSRQGAECLQSLLPALITIGGYGKERKKQGVAKELETVGYCVQFRLGPIPGSCRQVRAPHAQWMKYLAQGHMVCVRCEWPAQDIRSRRCYGDGGEAAGNQLLLWQAAGHPRCQGTWERLGQLRDCSCPEVHSLIFI